MKLGKKPVGPIPEEKKTSVSIPDSAFHKAKSTEKKEQDEKSLDNWNDEAAGDSNIGGG